jgi:small neutral amino acid transporter SnatA (MarC family)
VDRLDLADAFITLFALLGPQKVLLSVARMARTREVHHVRLVMAYAALAAACVGVGCTLVGPWLASFFHITAASEEIAAGLVFFIYAVCLVFGIHLGDDPGAETGPPGQGGDAGPTAGDGRGDGHQPDRGRAGSDGFRMLLLPFIVSPLGVAAALEGSLTASDWSSRGVVAGAYAAVVAVDLLAAVLLAPLMRRIHVSSLEVASRLLGLLLSAVGVNLFLQGLAALGVHVSHG